MGNVGGGDCGEQFGGFEEEKICPELSEMARNLKFDFCHFEKLGFY